MPRYHYTAQAGSGQTVNAVVEAPSLPALAAKLESEGSAILTAREVRESIPRVRGVAYLEVVNIYRQVAASLESGLPLAETLELLAGESRDGRLKALIHYVRSQIKQGVPLSEAMKAFPEAFPPVHIAIIKAGEESGRLEASLAQLADQAESFANMSRRFASSLVYPTVVASAALALFVGAFTFIVPKFSVLFSDLGIRELPTVTAFILFMATKVAPITLMLMASVAMMVGVVVIRRRAAAGRLWVDSWKLRFPVVGQIVEKAALARFAGTLGLLLDAGVDMPRAVRLAADSAGNSTVEQLLKNVSTEIELGGSLSESIDRLTAMPPTMAWRIGVGEETGSLPQSLIAASRLYASQVDNLTISAAGLLEPVMVMIIGCGVGALVVGLFLPLASVIQNLSGV